MKEEPTEKELRYYYAKDDLTQFTPRMRASICSALFEKIEQGGEAHRAWLKKELEVFFSVDET